MTLTEALRASDTGGPEFMPIRRGGWVVGLRIWYSRSSVRWMVQSSDDEIKDLCGIPTQQCLTPATILANDWELAP